ncbi:MAG: alanine racemase [Deltaproteobacteria bacterium]|nr:alanine racemase [Deltaproteobacteria bacterium]MCL5792123.1 alanine racemase [Deltaproteobacteria bacterium]
MNNSYTYAIVSLKAIKQNLSTIKHLLNPETPVMGVVKSDAYGHGIIEVSHALEDAGINTLGIAFVNEGIKLRKAGIYLPIYVLSGFQKGEEEAVIKNNLIPFVYNTEQIKSLNKTAAKLRKHTAVHLKFDTGMGRLGFLESDKGEIEKILAHTSNINITGIASHLSDALNSPSYSRMQINRFGNLYKWLKGIPGHQNITGHIANTGALIAYPESQFDMVRVGIGLYGYGDKNLTPAMSVFTSLISVKMLKKGTYISYGRTARLRHDTRIGVLPIGYADGYNRMLSNKGWVGINGKKAYTSGVVTMNHTMVKLDDIKAKIYDRVLVMGKDKGVSITAEDIAESCSTISYEILCALGSHIRKQYKS